MQVVVFGTGKEYQLHREEIMETAQITAFLDNNAALWGTELDGAVICAPDALSDLAYDLIIVASARVDEMTDQLLAMGIRQEGIVPVGKFTADMLHRGEIRVYGGGVSLRGKKKVLIITDKLYYNGGALTVTYAARVLSDRGYGVVIASEAGNKSLIGEVNAQGITVLIAPALPYADREEFWWIDEFDFVIVNTFVMIRCAVEIARFKKVLWWIHEPGEFYPRLLRKYPQYREINYRELSGLHIRAVSPVARKYFNSLAADVVTKELMLGIPDTWKHTECAGRMKGKLIYAVTGGLEERKGQKIMLEAFCMMARKDCALWLIGRVPETEYAERIVRRADGWSDIRICGEKTRQEMEEMLPQIDVLVCPSLDEPVPTAVVEGMMYGKVCIVSDTAGIAAYIQDGVNGFLFRTGDAGELAEKIQWAAAHQERLEEIGLRARDTYEQYFRLEEFGNRLEKAMLEP